MIRICAWTLIAALAITDVGFAADASPSPDLKAWRLLADSPRFPAALSNPMGVYDPVRRRVLAIEADFSNRPLIVHIFEPGSDPHWSVLEASGGPPRRPYLASIVYDPSRDRLVVLGRAPGQELETWTLPLSGTPTWQRLSTSGTSPQRRGGHSTIYDPVHDRIVLFGGNNDFSPESRYLADTWALSLTSGEWSELAPLGTTPGGREGHGAIYDPDEHRMIVFGGHHEIGGRGFRNDVWELSLGDTLRWSQILPIGPLPGPRSAFGTVYDPLRRRLLIHGGVNASSGVEPDDLWALTLEGEPMWVRIVTQDTLRGRSYPIDVYDPVEDRILACGGHGYPQTSSLSLAAQHQWDAILPSKPLPAPGARSRHAVVHDTRRDRHVVIGGDYSSADSAIWTFTPETGNSWRAVRAAPAPFEWFEYSRASVYDSLSDRIILFTGWQAWSLSADSLREWSPLGSRRPDQSPQTGPGAGIAFDSRRLRLIVTGGWIPYPHGAGYTLTGVWSLSLGNNPEWSLIGTLPIASADHSAFYDSFRDQLIIIGGFYVNDRPLTRYSFGATVWTSPMDSVLSWTMFRSTSGPAPPAPPDAWVAFDPRGDRLFIAKDSAVWTRRVRDNGPWTSLEFIDTAPLVTSAITYDSPRDQLLALYASAPGSDHVQTWAAAVGALSVSLLDARRSENAIELRWRSLTAYGRAAIVERREPPGDWTTLGPIAFGIDGIAAFADHQIEPEHDYSYRVSVAESPSSWWHSEPVLVSAPSSLRLALLGARPNPAVKTIRLAFSLPENGAARLEVFDVRGRRRLAKVLSSLGPGRHTIVLEGSDAWPPGVYYVRLRSGEESRSTRVVLMP
jgi:hypothetical protein